MGLGMTRARRARKKRWMNHPIGRIGVAATLAECGAGVPGVRGGLYEDYSR
jgi:hypothetical protein